MQRVTPARTAHLAFVGLVAAVALVATFFGRHPATLLATFTASVTIASQMRRGRATTPAWRPVLAGVVVLTLDAAASLVLTLVTDEPVANNPFTIVSLPVGFALLLLGCLLLVSPAGRRNFGALIDAALVAVTATSILWAVLLRPHLDRVDADPLTLVAAVLTVLVFGGMTGALVKSWLAQGGRHAGTGYVLASAAAGFTGNALKVLSMQDPALGAPWWIAIFWGVAYAGASAAALHPTGASVAVPNEDERLTRTRVVGLAAALLAAPAIVGAQAQLGAQVDGVLIAANAVVVVPLVLARLWIVAEQLRQAQERLAHLAEHDELTGLANRRAVTASLRQTLARVADGRVPGALVAFVDLDDFKSVNDGLGHPVGDRLLVAVATRLRTRLRASDVVARFGGDEFLIVCEGEPEQLEERVRRALEGLLDEPFDVGDAVLECRASLGTALVRAGETPDLDELLSTADAAMYRQKGRAAR